MIVLLVILAIVGTISLIVSSFGAINDVTPTEMESRGRWGVVSWQWQRTRRLDAHERRWQTALITAAKQPTRWPDLVAEIERLERSADVASDPTPPSTHDAAWVDARLTALEQHLDTLTGDST